MKRAAVLAFALLLPRVASADDAPSVRVHIDSPEPVYLQAIAPGEETWVDACMSPCNRELPTTSRYRLVGAGVQKEIVLVGRRDGTFDITVDKPAKSNGTFGLIFTSAGGLTTLAGLVLALSGNRLANVDCAHPPSGEFATRPQCDAAKESGPSQRAAGLVALGVGAVVTTAGVWLMLRARRPTEVTVRAPEPDVVVRRPETTRPAQLVAAPATFPVVLGGTF